MSTTWSNHNRQQLADAEHDIAVRVVEGLPPRPEDVETVRRLLAKRHAYLEATEPKLAAQVSKLSDLAPNRPDPAQLEAGHLGDPESSPATDDDNNNF
ncbi:hypothetical protein [Sinomonas sp. P10A9]|uniref:Uncharacterized protein n=1 Tax=Sinomonas puerhi TaxID=3238584 RepID=A0AB39L0X6_9MICC